MSLTIIIKKRDYLTENITGKRIHVRSVRQEKELLKVHGLVHYDKNSKARNRYAFMGDGKTRNITKKELKRLREVYGASKK